MQKPVENNKLKVQGKTQVRSQAQGKPKFGAASERQHYNGRKAQTANNKNRPQRTPLSAREAALQVLNQVFLEGAYTNLALNKLLPEVELSQLDRRFATELVYGTVKAKGTLDWYLDQLVTRPLTELQPVLLNILRLGLYQLYYLDRVPASAAVNESVKLARRYGHEGLAKFANGVLRNAGRREVELKSRAQTQEPVLALALSGQHPVWLIGHWLEQLGLKETQALCEFDNQSPALSLRVNTLELSRAAVLEELQKLGCEVEVSRWSPDGILCHKLSSLAQVMEKLGSALYIQDESSMLAARVLNPQPGEKVLDMCSAPGGKATHLSALMQDEGQVYACDIHPHKLELIKFNARRLQIKNLTALLQDGCEFKPEWEAQFDRVLVDAPCSGLGVLRRRAEARWTKKEQDLAQFPPLQLAILNNGARYVKAGGRLLYSTCTLEKAENEGVVRDFLQDHPRWQRVAFKHPLTGEELNSLQLWPQRDGVDGFYLALLEKVK